MFKKQKSIKIEPPADRGGDITHLGTKMSKLSTRGYNKIIAHSMNNARHATKNI